MEVVWCVLGVEGFGPFGVGIEGCQELGEGGVCFIGVRVWERDVFWGDYLMINGYVFGDVVCWKASGDFGRDRESGDSEGRRPIQLV